MLARNIETEIEALVDTSLTEVKERWQATFGTEPPKGLSRKFMIRVLAHELQVCTFGKLKPRHAKQLKREIDPETHPITKSNAPTLVPGTRLLREWRGICHRVDVTEDGFRWENKTHTSLSAIAHSITGTRWNGPLFFGLRKGGNSQ